MFARSQPLLVLCALLSLGARAPSELDALQLSCATFTEMERGLQRRILAFLQGYRYRSVPDDKVGSVPIGAGLERVVESCRGEPSATTLLSKIKEVASAKEKGAPGDARLTRPPTEITCKQYTKLSRDDQRLTVYWLDGYSRKDPNDTKQGVVALDRDPETFAKSACSRREQRLWWAIQGSVRSVPPAPAS